MFLLARDIKSPSPDYLNIGMIVINNKQTAELEPAFQWKLRRNLKSILTFSSGDPLHFIIITDRHSINIVHHCISNLVSKYVSSFSEFSKFPPLFVLYASLL